MNPQGAINARLFSRQMPSPVGLLSHIGGEREIRTPDRRRMKALLYQLSYITILKYTTLFFVAAAEQHCNVLQYGNMVGAQRLEL